MAALFVAPTRAQTVQDPPYSTHDWFNHFDPLVEAWADVKTPGDGRQYAVGTIEVDDSGNNVLFSNWPVEIAGSINPFQGLRQVVMLQVTNTDPGQGIVWQRFFYGTTGVAAATRASNARAISVWPAATDGDTRVAICGETYDETLPLSQASFPSATATSPTGFIAVFDGGGTLLWTHHLFGTDPTGSCAITDLSVRVEVRGGVAHDVVTYCGISSHGVPATATPLSPVRPFAQHEALLGSDGATDQGLGQWDGIVGRVTRTSGGANTVEFHSIVGGDEQDGLFGIAEFDENHFVVVGGTKRQSSAAPTPGRAFPGASTPAPFVFSRAPVLTFDASGVPGGNLVLSDGYVLGGQGEEKHSIARDVIVLRDGFASGDPSQTLPTTDPIVVVGSTDDAQFFTQHVLYPTGVIPLPPQYVRKGATDGFVSLFTTAPLGTSFAPYLGAYHGGDGHDGLTGVQYWSEYPDEFAVVGFTDGFDTIGSPQVSVETFYVSTETITLWPLLDLRSLRRTKIGASGFNLPAVMGPVNATTLGLPFLDDALGPPAGGGIAVDQRARVHVVGQTQGPNYPVAGGGRAYDQSLDAVRSVLDMLPPGIGRTDGTGVQAGFVLPSGFSGGTTPLCALSPFGKQIGMPAPVLPRMLIEYEGPDLDDQVSNAAIIVSRPTAPFILGQPASSVVMAGWQFGLPGATMPPVMLPSSGLELYTTDPAAFFSVAGFGYTDQAFRLPLLPLPGGMTMTVQLVCWVPSFVPGGPGSGPCSGLSEFTSSPAMWLIVP